MSAGLFYNKWLLGVWGRGVVGSPRKTHSVFDIDTNIDVTFSHFIAITLKFGTMFKQGLCYTFM